MFSRPLNKEEIIGLLEIINFKIIFKQIRYSFKMNTLSTLESTFEKEFGKVLTEINNEI